MPTTYEVYELPRRGGGTDEQGVRRYQRVFKVFSDNPSDGPQVVAAQVPYLLYQAYDINGENDPFAILKHVDVQPVSSELGEWDVVLSYDSARNAVDTGTGNPHAPGTPPSAAGSAANSVQPDFRPWVYKWGSVSRDELLTHARDGGIDPDTGAETLGTPVLNSAGVPFDPPPVVPVANATLHITGYRSVANVDKILQFVNHVNNSTLFGVWPADWVRCTSYEISTLFEQGRFFAQIDVTLEFKRGGWNPLRVLDQGTMYRPTSVAPLQNVKDPKAGEPATKPVLLDGHGGLLAPGAAPVYLEFQGYPRRNFAQLI